VLFRSNGKIHGQMVDVLARNLGAPGASLA